MMKASITELCTPPEEGCENYQELKDAFVERPHLQKVVASLNGNTSIIFTNKDLLEIADILDANVREAPAKSGSIAPKDVIVPAGPTGLDPRQTAFFGTLGIATKIQKAQIEILNDNTVITTGEKITPGQVALLEKLKIRPFEYKMTVVSMLMDGQLLDSAVLRITPDVVRAKFAMRAANITALSLGSGYVIPSAAPHLIMKAFKNLAAISFATDYSFPQAAALKAAASAAPVASSGGATKAAEKEESEKKESSDAGMAMDLFGGDDEY